MQAVTQQRIERLGREISSARERLDAYFARLKELEERQAYLQRELYVQALLKACLAEGMSAQEIADALAGDERGYTMTREAVEKRIARARER